jgi:signal transduction histidine kinase
MTALQNPRWVVVATFAALLGLTLGAASVAVRALRDMYAGQLAARHAADTHSEETELLGAIRTMLQEQRMHGMPVDPLLMEWSQNASEWNARRLERDDQMLLEQFGRLQGTLYQAFLIALASALALVAASMIYILRLERQTHSRNVELQQLSSRLVDAQESERRSISRELHDEIGQSLGALLVDLSRFAATVPADQPEVKGQVERMKTVAENSVQAVRDMSLLLRPSMLDDLGLGPALEWQGREVSRRSDIEVEVHSDGAPSDVPAEYATCIYRVVQEALNNTVRHSGARTARVDLERNGRGVRVRVTDDGHGFDPKRARGLGILGMGERVKRLGGTFTIDSAPGRGTTVTAELPLGTS